MGLADPDPGSSLSCVLYTVRMSLLHPTTTLATHLPRMPPTHPGTEVVSQESSINEGWHVYEGLTANWVTPAPTPR